MRAAVCIYRLAVAVCTVLTLTLQTLPIARAESGERCGDFSDMPATHPDCRAVLQLAARTIVSGRPDGTYGPEAVLTRAEFAKLVVVALGQQPQPGGILPFDDIAGHWAANLGYLQTAHMMGLMQGTGGGKFMPDGPLTRSQFVKVLAAAVRASSSATVPYTDLDRNAWYMPYITAGYGYQLMGSRAAFPLWEGPQFGPDVPVTRKEAARGLLNFLSVME